MAPPEKTYFSLVFYINLNCSKTNRRNNRTHVVSCSLIDQGSTWLFAIGCETIRLKHATLSAKLPINVDYTSWGVAWMKCKGTTFLQRNKNSDETFEGIICMKYYRTIQTHTWWRHDKPQAHHQGRGNRPPHPPAGGAPAMSRGLASVAILLLFYFFNFENHNLYFHDQMPRAAGWNRGGGINSTILATLCCARPSLTYRPGSENKMAEQTGRHCRSGDEVKYDFCYEFLRCS